MGVDTGIFRLHDLRLLELLFTVSFWASELSVDALEALGRWENAMADLALFFFSFFPLSDNPVGILAYIGDKFHEWSDVSASEEHPASQTDEHLN